MPEPTQPPTRSDAAEASRKKGRSKKDLPQVEGGLLDTDHAAAKLGISRRTFQEKIAAREIACIRIGRSVRFHPDDLDAFIQASRVKAIGWKGGSRP
jgi:excisionase family DNA binding protein